MRFTPRLLEILGTDYLGSDIYDIPGGEITSARGPRGSRTTRYIEIEGEIEPLAHRAECRNFHFVFTEGMICRVPCAREARWGWHVGTCQDAAGRSFTPDGQWD